MRTSETLEDPERWSFGFQRQLPQSVVLDASYVGSESHELTTVADWNPRLIGGVRLYTPSGPVIAKTSQGNSSYHALQASLNRRITRGFQLAPAYTWSKLIDSTSEGVGYQNLQQPDRMNRTSVPVMQGGLKLDRGLSDFATAAAFDDRVSLGNPRFARRMAEICFRWLAACRHHDLSVRHPVFCRKRLRSE